MHVKMDKLFGQFINELCRYTGCLKKKYRLLFCSFLGFQNILKKGSVHFSTAQPLQNQEMSKMKCFF